MIKTEQKRRNQTIDIARIVFAFMIVLNHLNTIISEYPATNLLITRYGFLGVEFFFIVSGYLMAKKGYKEINSGGGEFVPLNAAGRATPKFIIKKIGIIFPYYIVSFCFVFVISQISNGAGAKKIFADLVLSIPEIMQLHMAGYVGYAEWTAAWYLSAMCLSMLILYPLLLRLGDYFTDVIAPVIAVFCYGHILLANNMKFAAIEPLQGDIVFAGMLRGLAGISLGCTCYKLSEKLSNIKFSRSGRIILTIIEIAMYLSAVLAMQTQNVFRPDCVLPLIFAAAVIISFSGCSNSGSLFKKDCPWLGKVSLCLYFADTPARKIALLFAPDVPLNKLMLLSLLMTVALMFIIWVLGNLLKKACGNCAVKLKAKLIEE